MSSNILEMTDDEIDCVNGGFLRVVATIVINVVSNAIYDAAKGTDTSGGNTSQGQDQMGNMY